MHKLIPDIGLRELYNRSVSISRDFERKILTSLDYRWLHT